MKVIALKGEENNGKCTTLKRVYEILRASSWEPELKEWEPKDFREVINIAGKKIGIVIQGYSGIKKEMPVRDHLEILKNQGCDIVICACTAREDIPKHFATIFIDKEKSKEKSVQQIENTPKAMEIIQILNLWLLDATK